LTRWWVIPSLRRYRRDPYGYRNGINVPLADPWYDYLAIPIGPLVLLLQLASIFLPERTMRWTIGLGCTATLTAMLFYVSSLDLNNAGANIGAGVLALWLICSIALLAAAGLRDVVTVVGRRFRRSRAPGTG
jgi:hypothetical protein